MRIFAVQQQKGDKLCFDSDRLVAKCACLLKRLVFISIQSLTIIYQVISFVGSAVAKHPNSFFAFFTLFLHFRFIS